MGVEYAHYLIPEDNTYKPHPEELSRLVKALLDRGFVADPASDAFRKTLAAWYPDSEYAQGTGCSIRVQEREESSFPCPFSAGDLTALREQDYQIVWHVESTNESGIKYPLTPFPEWGDAYYDLELHLAKDFVYHCSELIDPFKEVVCDCGRSLVYSDDKALETVSPEAILRIFFASRIHRFCPWCGRPFRPQSLVARVRDGRTGEAQKRAGGATYLFAVVIDCGKSFPREGWPIRVTDEFLDTVTKALEREFSQLGDFY
jgi:hypothetical protein